MFITLGFFASALDTFINIMIFLLVLSLVICIHELGHLFFAKRAGILCHEFSFGMGPRLWSVKKGETRYSIRAIPFGGFVSMAGEEIEAEIVHVGDKIGLVLDQSQHVTKIILSPSKMPLDGMIEVVVESFDLTNEDSLFINEFKVNEKAMYVFPKNEMQIAPKGRRFNDKSKTNRFLTTFGGPLMNFILAFVIYLTIALIIGVPDQDSVVLGGVSENMPAQGVLIKGDEIIEINGLSVDSWSGTEDSIVSRLAYLEDQRTNSYVFTVIRDGQTIELSPIQPMHVFYNLGFTLDPSEEGLVINQPLYTNSKLLHGDVIVSINGQSFADVNALIDFSLNYTLGSTEDNPTEIVILRNEQEMTFTYVSYSEEVLNGLGYQIYFSRIGIESASKFSIGGSFSSAGGQFVGASTSIFSTLRLLFSSNQVGVRDLSGFVGIFSMVRQASALGLIYLFQFIALLSVNLGILNLLPIPALDGGRIVFLGYEAITKKKPNQRVENFLHTIVFFLLITLMVYVTYHDILRLIGLK